VRQCLARCRCRADARSQCYLEQHGLFGKVDPFDLVPRPDIVDVMSELKWKFKYVIDYISQALARQWWFFLMRLGLVFFSSSTRLEWECIFLSVIVKIIAPPKPW